MATLASKRKRETHDMPNPRAHPGMGGDDFENHYLPTGDDGMDHHDPDMGFAAALAQHNADAGDVGDLQQGHGHSNHQGNVNEQGGPSASDTAAAAMAQYHTMTVPQSTEQAFMSQQTENRDNRPTSSSIDHHDPSAQHRTSSFGGFDMSASNGQAPSNGDGSPGAPGKNQSTPKPQVGTEEWHKVRRDNHKEVERRRRETINEGINELAKIVPGCEKNKGSILARAVQFIIQLKENETQNIEKWTLEKLLTEQAIAELSSSCDKLKAECQRAWAECEQWKKAAQKAGVSIDDEKGDADGEDIA